MTYQEKKNQVIIYVKENKNYCATASIYGYTIENYISCIEYVIRNDLEIKFQHEKFLAPGVLDINSNSFCLDDILKINNLIKLVRYSKFLIYMHSYVLSNNVPLYWVELARAHQTQYFLFSSKQLLLTQLLV